MNFCLFVVILLFVQQSVCVTIKHAQAGEFTVPMSQLQDGFDKVFAKQCDSFFYRPTYKKNIQNIQNLAGFDISKPLNSYNNIDTVTYVRFTHRNAYTFPNSARNGNYTTSSIVYFPTAKKTLKGVVAYFHPTLFAKDGSPSSHSVPQFKAIAGFYVSQGYAIVMADQIGIGIDYQNSHPYVLFPQQNVLSTVYALQKAFQILNNQGYDDILDLVVAGYSEGGAYCAWFDKCYNQGGCKYLPSRDKLTLPNGYRYRGAAGLEGAYDLSSITRKFLLSQVGSDVNNNEFQILNQAIVNSVKPALISLAIDSYSAYGRNAPAFSEMLNPAFYNMKCDIQGPCDYNNTHRTLTQLLRLKSAKGELMLKAIVASALGKRLGNVSYAINILTSSKNSGYALVKQEYADAPEFILALKEGTIVDYSKRTKSNIFVFSLAQDSVVTVNNFDRFVHGAPENVKSVKFDNDDFHTCNNLGKHKVDHIGAELLANVFALNFFNEIIQK